MRACAHRFDNIVDTFVPLSDGSGDKCYISESYDPSRCVRKWSWVAMCGWSRAPPPPPPLAPDVCVWFPNVLAVVPHPRLLLPLFLHPPLTHSHFETTSIDILNLYARVTGERLSMDLPSEIPRD